MNWFWNRYRTGVSQLPAMIQQWIAKLAGKTLKPVYVEAKRAPRRMK